MAEENLGGDEQSQVRTTSTYSIYMRTNAMFFCNNDGWDKTICTSLIPSGTIFSLYLIP